MTDIVSSAAEVAPYFERNLAWLALSIPAGYGRDIGASRPTVVQVLADGTDANSTNIALGYATGLVAGYAQDLALAKARTRAARDGGARTAGCAPTSASGSTRSSTAASSWCPACWPCC